MARRPMAAAMVAGVALAGLTGTGQVAATIEAPIDAGDVLVIDRDGEPLDRGGSAAEFGLQLPEGATCPGDSMHDGWVAQSFVVPSGNDPATLTYGVIGPEGDDQYALYMLDTNPFVDFLTLSNDVAGKPGRLAIPEFTFNEFPPGTLPDGSYRIGIACTYFERKTAMFWDTEIVVAASADDAPGQMVWRLATAPAEVDQSDDGRPIWVALAAGAVLVLVLAYGGILVRRRTRQPAHSVKDRS